MKNGFMNPDNIDIMKVEEEYVKMSKKAGIADQFKLRCWIDYCRKGNVVTYLDYLKNKTCNHFLDKLHYGLVKFDDIADEETLETALVESFES